MTQITVAVTQSTVVANITKRKNMSDADFQILIDTVKKSVGRLPPVPGQSPPPPPTNEELAVMWIERWFNQTISDIQVHNTVPPPPVVITDA